MTNQQPHKSKSKKPKSNKNIGVGKWSIDQFKVEPQEGKMRFHDLDLPLSLMRGIHQLGFEYCSPIQAQALPHTLDGYDIIGKAQTGTGKTAAFLINVITDLMENPLEKQFDSEPRSLILAPTRELALQIGEDSKGLNKFTGLTTATLVGGMDYDKQLKQVEGKVDILVATPGRLIDFMRRKSIFLDQVEILVIDEADRMMDMGFIPDVKTIERATPFKNERQTLLFSATFSQDIINLSERWTNDPVKIEIEPEIKTSDAVEQKIYLVSAEEKYPLLRHVLEEDEIERVMIFANRRDLVRDLSERLKKDGFDCALLSGDVPQQKRLKTLERFKSGQVKFLVATDVAGRGIHVDGVSHVVNFTLPEDAEDYVHRIGRTGRAGAKGKSVSFACEDDSFQIPALEEYIGNKLDLEEPPSEWLTDSNNA